MVSQTKKEEFLANAHKQRFINMLGNRLQIVGCEVHHAGGDADLLVVTTAVACAEQGDTVVIADDTDILILLIHHAGHVERIWFQPNPKKKSKKKLTGAGTLLQQYPTLGQRYAAVFSLRMLYSGVTPHLEYLVSAKARL
ncbi:Uncharacterised protein r2_g707 [Pycnogonum litorale]